MSYRVYLFYLAKAFTKDRLNFKALIVFGMLQGVRR